MRRSGKGEAIGALNLFHRQLGSLPTVDLALGHALADVATIGILSERAIRRSDGLNEQLQSVLNSRVIIEQAHGQSLSIRLGRRRQPFEPALRSDSWRPTLRP